MTVLSDVLKELFGMFVSDARLSVAVLALVGLVALWLKAAPGIDPQIPGVALLLGCIAINVTITSLHARRMK